MKARVTILLEEAMGRYLHRQYHNPDESLTEAWTGLGYPSDYKPVLEEGLMEWMHGQPPPRCMGWLRLTEAGAEIVAEWLREE